MGIKMNTYAGGQMTAGNDAILHDRALAKTGILQGCNITFMGANQVHIEKGYLLIKGRYCTVTEDTIQVEMSDSETELQGRLYVHADLADAQEPVKILSLAANQLPELIQDENFNYDNGIWEMELATYTAGMTSIKDLTPTCEEVPEGATKKETAELLDKINELSEKITAYEIKTITLGVGQNVPVGIFRIDFPAPDGYTIITPVAFSLNNRDVGQHVSITGFAPYPGIASILGYSSKSFKLDSPSITVLCKKE